jgi:hypothetical protein
MALRVLQLGTAFALGVASSADDFAAALEADDVCRTSHCALELSQLRAAVRPGLSRAEPSSDEFHKAAASFQQKHAMFEELESQVKAKSQSSKSKYVGEVDAAEAGRLCRGMNFSTSVVSHSNLGGQGPDDGPETLVYQGVAIQDGQEVDLVVTAASPYEPNSALKNGLHGGLFGIINQKVNNAVDLNFRFVDRQGSPVTMDPFFFTLYDIDQGMDHASRESVTARGFSEYRVAEETELRIEVLGDDSATFTSSLRGGKVDNPTHPMALTNAEKERTVVLKFPETSEFSLTFSEAAYADEDQGRNLLFSGPSSMVCGREHMCTDYICPDGYHIRTMAEFLVCAGRRCEESDRDTCCYEIPADADADA